jgi:hypothetical protein
MSIDQKSRPELSDAEKRSLMSTIKRIVAIYDELVPIMSGDQRIHREEGVRPYYHQTTNGIYLLFVQGFFPYELWTPWGAWQFGGDRASKGASEDFKSRLTLCEYAPVTHQEWEAYGGVYGWLVRHESYGPVYAVLAVEGEGLPEPTPVLDRAQFGDVDLARQDWSRYFAEAS